MKSVTTLLAVIGSLALATVSLTACASQAPNHKTQQNKAQQAKVDTKAAINYRVSKERVAVGEPIQIYLSANNHKDDVVARLQTSEKLLLSGQSQMTFKAGQNQLSEEQVITVIPQSEGIHLVTIFAKELSVAYEKPIAIQLVAGNKPISDYLEVNGTLEEQKNGEKVISMPAEER